MTRPTEPTRIDAPQSSLAAHFPKTEYAVSGKYAVVCGCGFRGSYHDNYSVAKAKWGDHAVAALSASGHSALPSTGIDQLVEAAQGIIERMSSTFKSRNGREVGIQGDDGEKCWIVHSDDIETLRDALAKHRQP